MARGFAPFRGDAVTISEGESMQAVGIAALPEELRSRVLAATAHASHRCIRRLRSPDEAGASYAVEALSGDRVTLMRLSVRPDESVDESTDSFITRDILDVDRGACELTVQGPEGTRRVTIAPDTAEVLRALDI